VRRFFEVLAVLCLLWFGYAVVLNDGSGAANADERISDFRVTATVGADSSLTIREEITVTVEGREIRRGIIRAVPTLYRKKDGKTERVDFTLLSASLDGRRVGAATSTSGRDTEIRLGDSDVMLSHEAHTFDITYRIAGQVSFFDSHDELFWNVTGDEWTFPIDRAEYRIVLPGDGYARITGVAFFTGRPGENGKDAQRLPDGSFVTTRTLRPGEGFSVAVGWPKGLVTPPPLPLRERIAPFVTRYRLPISILFVALFLAYYGYAWHRKGRDPTPQVIPLFRPPEGVSPGFARFFRTGRMDATALVAELIELAVDGHIRFGEADEETLTLLRNDGAPSADTLPQPVRTFLTTVFPAGTDRLDISAKKGNFALKRLHDGLEAEYKRRSSRLMIPNLLLRLGGVLLFVPMIWTLSVVSPPSGREATDSLFPVLIGAPLAFAGITGIVSVFRGMRGRGIAERVRRFIWSSLLVGLFGVSVNFALRGDIALSGGVLAAWTVVAVFWKLLPARTQEGAKLAADIDGLAMYIGTAETERLEAMNPPEETPETFEKILPYAVALDLADTWAARFEKILAQAAYAPSWTATGGDILFNVGMLRDAGSRTISSSIARAVVARSSSGGSRRVGWSGSGRGRGLGGGGSSGGGGGGGGGRGW
jgi:uncharacterized membrane protein YgcG